MPKSHALKSAAGVAGSSAVSSSTVGPDSDAGASVPRAAPLSPVLEVDVHGLGVAGEGVARLDDGRVLFVPGALPGDRACVRVEGTRKHLLRASLLEVVQPSEHRVPATCQSVDCGGCALREFDYQAQLRHKRDQLVNNLRRLGRIDVESLLGPVVTGESPWRYRHRVRLHAQWHKGRWELGYYQRRSHTLVPLVACPVLWPQLQQVATDLQEALGGLPKAAQLQEVTLAYSRIDDRATACLHGRGSIVHFRRHPVWSEVKQLSGVHVVAGDGRSRLGNLLLRYDHAHADVFDLKYEPSFFTQANPAVNDELVAAVLAAARLAQQPRVLELHAGIGNFSVPLARAGAQITAVEQHPRAARRCEYNGAAPGLHLQVHAMSDKQAIEQALAGTLNDGAADSDDRNNASQAESVANAAMADVLLLDPPRSGAWDACKAIAAAPAGQRPARIIYVSCDTATLARDAAALVQQGGYHVVSAQAFDMFPQTPHLETLLVFEREAQP